MGHANLTNISEFMVRRIYAKGNQSVTELQLAFSAKYPNDGLRASEGIYTEPEMIRMAMEEIINYWQITWPMTPVLIPIEPMTADQKSALEQWTAGQTDDWDVGDDGETGRYAVFDSIRWAFGKGWRKKYPDIPLLGQFEN